MNTTPVQPDAVDPHLDNLLSAALSPDAAPRGLSERVVARTLPRLGRGHHGGVLARLAPVAARVAAVLVFAVGAALYVSMASHEAGQIAPPGDRTTPWGYVVNWDNTNIDVQINLLALAVELADSRDAWESSGQSWESAIIAAELDAMADPVMFF